MRQRCSDSVSVLDLNRSGTENSNLPARIIFEVSCALSETWNIYVFGELPMDDDGSHSCFKLRYRWRWNRPKNPYWARKCLRFSRNKSDFVALTQKCLWTLCECKSSIKWGLPAASKVQLTKELSIKLFGNFSSQGHFVWHSIFFAIAVAVLLSISIQLKQLMLTNRRCAYAKSVSNHKHNAYNRTCPSYAHAYHSGRSKLG